MTTPPPGGVGTTNEARATTPKALRALPEYTHKKAAASMSGLFLDQPIPWLTAPREDLVNSRGKNGKDPVYNQHTGKAAGSWRISWR
jgi:hypothetical protein